MGQQVRQTEAITFYANYEIVHDVLLNTEAYPDFIDAIEKAEVLDKGEHYNEARMYARLIIPFSYTMYTEKVHRENIRFWQTSGFFKNLSGHWLLEPKEKTVEAQYVIEAELPAVVPKKVTELALNVYFPSMVRAFQNEAKRRAIENSQHE